MSWWNLPLWIVASCDTIQYSGGSVSMTLNSTVHMLPWTKDVLPLLMDWYAGKVISTIGAVVDLDVAFLYVIRAEANENSVTWVSQRFLPPQSKFD